MFGSVDDAASESTRREFQMPTERDDDRPSPSGPESYDDDPSEVAGALRSPAGLET